jgi:hypothetical protein
MGTKRIAVDPRGRLAAPLLLACLCAGIVSFTAAEAAAQDAAKRSPPAQSENKDFFGKVWHWFGHLPDQFNSNLKDAGSQVGNFGREAGIAAKTTVDAAKDAADAVARIPGARLLTVHEKCAVAPNGAPDCVAVATNTCKAKGFQSGKSMDMTTAEVCPPQVLLSGRSSGPECHDETFVSRVLCQ